jgi:hypothetical protein
MWRDPGAWIAIGVSLRFLVVALAMRRLIVRIPKDGSADPKHE